MKMLVLAGGFGTRLSNILNGMPKALVAIEEKPFLYYQIQNWKIQGITSFVFLLHHKADLIIDFLNEHRDGLLQKCNVNYVIEPEPLGTGGAIKNALTILNINESFLVVNADTWISDSLVDLITMSPPVLAYSSMCNVDRYGSINVTEEGLIDSFVEKKIGNPFYQKYKVNAGLALLSPSVFLNVPEKIFSIEEKIFKFLSKHKKLKAYKLQNEFIDIGIESDYYKFCQYIKSHK